MDFGGWSQRSSGRPALLATTTEFLNDFGLKSLEELPNAEDLIVAPTEDLLDQMDIMASERLQKVLAELVTGLAGPRGSDRRGAGVGQWGDSGSGN